MHFVPVTPPALVESARGFDYVTADSAARRIYAAHTGSNALLVVNADNGKVVGQVEVGTMHGVAVDPQTGHVYTGNGLARSVSEVDPVSLNVLRTANVDGQVDAIAYDPVLHRVYADEDDGTHVYVVDTKTMKQIAAVPIPGHKPEYLAVDPQTHDVYQNIDNLGEVAVIGASVLKVTRTFPTPAIQKNHPLQYDSQNHILLIGGKNGVLASYTTQGKLLGTVSIQPSVDQCSYNPTTRQIACAGSGKVTVVSVSTKGELKLVGSMNVAEDVHTVAFDPKTGNIWIVWADDKGAEYVQGFTPKP
ncbi:MAG: YncE family protein [Candidatus Eremiobacteraeota bacterium]|nr:YncE family protein [Candidatus Eremiobacteraeota bacterium]MBV8595671.1 YncE family protein [Candidatus Eremiobacteraeota bacterium]